MRSPKLNPEQEREVYRRAKAGVRYADIQAWLASQGTRLAKSSISELRMRIERRALAQRPPALPDEYIDPRTGAYVEVSYDMELEHMLRLMMSHAFDSSLPPACQRGAVKLAMRIMAARRKWCTESLAQRR